VALSTDVDRATSALTRRRLPGPDVVRAIALIGVVVMNYHGYLIITRGDGDAGAGWAAELFDPWNGPLSTRFAATFVLVAGVGVTLMTRSTVDAARGHDAGRARFGTGDPITAMRWRLVRRGVLLYTGGLVLEEIWPGTIIPFYGAMFVAAAAMFTWRSRWILVVGLVSALAGWAIRIWRYRQRDDGISTEWLTDPGDGSVRGYVFGVFVNGTHPLFPWLAFFCCGILLGRVLGTSWWRPVALGAGVFLAGIATAMSSGSTTPFQDVVLSTNPADRGLLYVTSALGTALAAYAAIDWLAERFPAATDPLRRAGQLSLSLYLLHIVVFNLAVDWLGWVEPAGLDLALTFAVGFWVVGLALAVGWQRRFGVGPAERVYRAFGG